MKKFIKMGVVVLMILAVVMGLSSCSKVDKDYGVESEIDTVSKETSSVKTTVDPEYVYPSIMSDDEVMPKFIDISLYDEEDYADVYLGKNFVLNAVYDGVQIDLPITYKEIKKLGWKLVENEEYEENSPILAGKTVKTELINENGKKLTAFFYNTDDSSVKLKKCNIVKIKIEENSLISTQEISEYGEFNINGINGAMVMTDVVDTMGVPSHFYCDEENEYYLEYFISEDDRRNGITVWVDIEDDAITAIEFSMYE